MKKIVVIEDDRAISGMYEFKLKQSGYDVRVAYDGVSGLRVIREFRPGLILLDLRMPHMSGDDMLEQLRQTEEGAHVRVVVLTNISKDEAPMKLRFLNVDRYVVKAHHTPAQVLEIIDEITGRDEERAAAEPKRAA